MEQSLNILPEPEKPFLTFGKTINNVIQNVKLPKFLISIYKPDNFCIVENRVIQITKIINSNGQAMFKGHIIKNIHSYFTSPIDSSEFNIYCCDAFEIGDEVEFNYLDITSKMVCLNKTDNDFHLFLPYIH